MENSFLRDAIDRITELARPSVMKVDDITSGNSSEIASLTISGNTVRVTWSYNGVINRHITLIYY